MERTTVMAGRHIKRAKYKHIIKKWWKAGLAVAAVLFIISAAVYFIGIRKDTYIEYDTSKVEAVRPDIDVELLTVNPYSRCGEKTSRINGIVIHYTANPGSTAMENRDYFEGLKDSHITQASSNFIVGLDGEIVQCVPTWEVAYASNSRNNDTVSIECCHPDDTGKFNDATYRSMVQLTAWLCLKFGLDENDVIRHYDITGKICPKYFVEHEDAWETFRSDVGDALARTEKD